MNRSKVTFSLLLAVASVFFISEAHASAIVHSAITGKVIDTVSSNGKVVRITVERPSWPKSRRFVVITSGTKFYREGNEATDLGYVEIQKGMMVRAEGGLSILGEKITADKIVILKAYSSTQESSLVHSVITGKVIDTVSSNGKVVRITVERPSWPKSRRFVVINNRTRFYREGSEGTDLGYVEINKGMMVRAEGGLSILGDKITADKIVILKSAH